MKKLLLLLCLVFFTYTNTFTQSISIEINPRGEGVTTKWVVTYNSSGIISSCKKFLISTEEVLEILTLETIINGFQSKYQVKALTVDNQIECGDNKLFIRSHVQNSLSHSDKTVNRIVSLNGDEISDVVNNSLIYRFNTELQQLLDYNGIVISERQENIIINNSDDTKMTIVEQNDVIQIIRENIPAIEPPTVIRITGNITSLKKSQLINYSILPYELQFLNFLM